MWRRNQEAAQRFAERRQRENEAARLTAIVPTLESLRLEMQENRAGISNPEATHIRRIVVANAPALFILPCHDTQCKDGGHDLTADVLSALRSRKQRFEGEDACSGVVGSANCQRVLRYIGVATYQDAPQHPAGGHDGATERPRPTR